jgi:hypothetical protein
MGNSVDEGSITKSRALITFEIVGTYATLPRLEIDVMLSHAQPCSHAADPEAHFCGSVGTMSSHARHRAEQLGRRVDRQKPKVPF